MKPPLKNNAPDDFQTPPIALTPLYPYLKKDWVIWECAAGNDNLVKALRSKMNIASKITGDDLKDLIKLKSKY